MQPTNRISNVHSFNVDPLQFLLLSEVAIIDQLAQTEAGQLLAPELNMPQFIVLNHLHRRGPEVSMGSAASAIQVTKGAMSNTAARLQAKGLIELRVDPNDGRGKLISLSLAGKQAREVAVVRLSKGLQGMGSVMTDLEFGQLLALLQKVRVWLDAKRD